MKCFLEFLTSPTVDTSGTSLLVHFDDKRYLIGNVCEGTQRAATQMGARLLKLSDLLITGRTEWHNLGGLIGIILTLADSNASAAASLKEAYQQRIDRGLQATMPDPVSLKLYGAPNLNHMLGTCRRYVFRKGMPLKATEFRDQKLLETKDGEIAPSWEDEHIRVWALSVTPPQQRVNAQTEFAHAAKKQTFDEKHSFEDHVAPSNETLDEREARYDRIRRSVVRHMFDSEWSFDTLHEQHISQVEMPATLYTRNPVTKQLELYTGPIPGGDLPLPDISVLTRKPWPGALLHALPPTKPAPESISYIMCTHQQRGKFDAKRADELNVSRPDRSALAKGQSVKNMDGHIITPDMVLGESKPGQGVAIIDLPSVEYVEPTISRKEWTAQSIMQGIRAFVWILGPGVSANSQLQHFMQKVDGPKHIIASPDHCPNRLALDSAASSTLRLGQVDPDRYGVPYHDNVTLPQSRYDLSPTRDFTPLADIMTADRGLRINLEPSFNIQSDTIVQPLHTAGILQATPKEVLRLAEDARSANANDREALESWKAKIPHPETEVITLGTGSALPSKYRNVSATLVRVPGVGSYLLDCGENTLGQLQRVFKPEELSGVLRDLRMVWISHLHADHHLGTTSVIKAWYSVVHNNTPAPKASFDPLPNFHPESTLSVVSDSGMLQWLFEYSSVEDFGYSRILPLAISPANPKLSIKSTLELYPHPRNPVYEGEFLLKQENYPKLLGVQDIQGVHVQHCRGALAVSFTFPTTNSSQPPLKISYSGDCRPSLPFAHIGHGSTVLIHEATFDDELLGDAKAKKHSTTSEALDIGVRMGAKAVVLTHFSQRYQKIPVLETIEEGENSAVESETNAGDEVEMDVPNQVQDQPMQDFMQPDPNPEGLVKHMQEGQTLASGPKTEQVIRVRSRDMKVALAFDYMRVKIGEIAQLEKFTPALSKLFEVDRSEEKEKKLVDGEKKGKKNGSKGDGEEGKKKKARRNN